VDQQSGHLTDGQIEQYGNTVSPTQPEAKDREHQIEAHLDDCETCRQRVLVAQRLRFALLMEPNVSSGEKARNPGSAGPAPDCPSEDDLRNLAAGLYPDEQAFKLTQHAANCDHCGPLLRMYTEDFSEDLSDDDRASLAKLKSASAGGQKKLVEAMLAALRGRSAAERNFSWKLILAPSVVAVCAVVAFVWLYPWWATNRARETVSSEYRRGRPMSYRAADVPYGPVNTEMGATVQLPAIEVPNPRRLPLVAANAAFLNRDPSLAKSILEDAYQHGDDSQFVLDDLVVAYAWEADRSGRKSDFEKALEFSGKALGKYPNDSTVYFNRALILEQLGKRDAAIAALRKFLTLEEDPNWKSEAMRILRGLS
jgi:tetratricopeptide (TPR) repeat protein